MATRHIKHQDPKLWNAGQCPLAVPKQNYRLELKMTGKVSNK